MPLPVASSFQFRPSSFEAARGVEPLIVIYLHFRQRVMPLIVININLYIYIY